MKTLPHIRPSVFGLTIDIYREPWHVNQRRPTEHGFDVEVGWPESYAGKGGARVILTPALADYLRRVPRYLDVVLPLADGALSRFRMELGMDYRSQRERWWKERDADLRALSHRAFAHKHGVSEVTVTQQFVRRYGAHKRPGGWYREADIANVLLTLPIDESAARLSIHQAAAQTYRKLLRRAQRQG